MIKTIYIEKDRIADFCQRWQIVEFALFGSVLREDFRPDSDIDVLVTFSPGNDITFDNRVQMVDELQAIFGREVDLIDKKTCAIPSGGKLSSKTGRFYMQPEERDPAYLFDMLQAAEKVQRYKILH